MRARAVLLWAGEAFLKAQRRYLIESWGGVQGSSWQQRLVETVWLQRVMRVAVMIAVGMLFGDGILTPSIPGAALGQMA